MGNFIKKLLMRIYRIDEAEYLKRFKKINIGNDCHFFNVTIDAGHSYLIEIGNECTLTNCTLLAHDASTKMYLNKSKVGKVKIGNRVFIGYGAIVLPNVTIGDDCIIGAGTIVTKDIPKNSVAIGNPAKVIGKVDEYVAKHRKMMEYKPVFNTLYIKKTQEEKENEKKLLDGTIGYDE